MSISDEHRQALEQGCHVCGGRFVVDLETGEQPPEAQSDSEIIGEFWVDERSVLAHGHCGIDAGLRLA